VFKIEPKTIEWLLEGDPSIRWQMRRDLLDEKPAVDKHSSFHTTCSVLEGLSEYEKNFPKSKLPLSKTQQSGREFLLQHELYKSDTSGIVVDEAMLRFPFLPQWKYDVLKGLEVFVAADAPRDKRLKDPIDHLKSKQDGDGRWPQYRMQAGKYFVQYETPGKPSRANRCACLGGGRVINKERAPSRPFFSPSSAY